MTTRTRCRSCVSAYTHGNRSATSMTSQPTGGWIFGWRRFCLRISAFCRSAWVEELPRRRRICGRRLRVFAPAGPSPPRVSVRSVGQNGRSDQGLAGCRGRPPSARRSPRTPAGGGASVGVSGISTAALRPPRNPWEVAGHWPGGGGMTFPIRVVAIADNGQEQVHDIRSLQRMELKMETLGLTLAEGKAILSAIQRVIVEQRLLTAWPHTGTVPTAGNNVTARGITIFPCERSSARSRSPAHVLCIVIASLTRPRVSVLWRRFCPSEPRRSCCFWRPNGHL